jgi:hypothetical protein
MSRRRGGRSSRADRYGIGDSEQVDDMNVGSAPYQLATDDAPAPAPAEAPPEPATTSIGAYSNTESRFSIWEFGRQQKTEKPSTEDVPSEEEPLSPRNNNEDVFHDEIVGEDGDDLNVEGGNENEDDDDDSLEGYDMTLQELMYSTSSFYAIVVPGTFRSQVSVVD